MRYVVDGIKNALILMAVQRSGAVSEERTTLIRCADRTFWNQ